MQIDTNLIDYAAQLAMLKLSKDEKAQAAQDLGRILSYVDMLSGLDTTHVEPMSHAFPVANVFREDEVVPSMEREELLRGAPVKKDGCFLVPQTVE